MVWGEWGASLAACDLIWEVLVASKLTQTRSLKCSFQAMVAWAEWVAWVEWAECFLRECMVKDSKEEAIDNSNLILSQVSVIFDLRIIYKF